MVAFGWSFITATEIKLEHYIKLQKNVIYFLNLKLKFSIYCLECVNIRKWRRDENLPNVPVIILDELGVVDTCDKSGRKGKKNKLVCYLLTEATVANPNDAVAQMG